MHAASASPSHIDLVVGDSVVHDTATVVYTEAITTCPDLCSVPHVLVSWGRLIKAIVLDIFKDIHKVLGSLGEPFHITMNPIVQGWHSGELS